MQFSQAQVESWVACIEVPKEELSSVMMQDLTSLLLIEKSQMLLIKYQAIKLLRLTKCSGNQREWFGLVFLKNKGELGGKCCAVIATEFYARGCTFH